MAKEFEAKFGEAYRAKYAHDHPQENGHSQEPAKELGDAPPAPLSTDLKTAETEHGGGEAAAEVQMDA